MNNFTTDYIKYLLIEFNSFREQKLIFLAYGFPKEIVIALILLYKNKKVMIRSTDDIESCSLNEIAAGVLQFEWHFFWGPAIWIKLLLESYNLNGIVAGVLQFKWHCCWSLTI